MYKGVCHCGNIRFTVSETPQQLVDCNCSLCRRIGGLWGHVDMNNVTIDMATDASIAYIQGDKTLATHSCKNCGCTTHWLGLNPEESSRMAVNFRMCDPKVIQSFRIRKLDGADTWEFLD